jgi:hypothetical protein
MNPVPILVLDSLKLLSIFTLASVGRDSSVGIPTRYGLDGESRWGRDFPQPGAHPASYTMGTGSFPGVKRPGRRVDQPPSSAEVAESGQIYLYSHSGLRGLV